MALDQCFMESKVAKRLDSQVGYFIAKNKLNYLYLIIPIAPEIDFL